MLYDLFINEYPEVIDRTKKEYLDKIQEFCATADNFIDEFGDNDIDVNIDFNPVGHLFGISIALISDEVTFKHQSEFWNLAVMSDDFRAYYIDPNEPKIGLTFIIFTE